jgi:hypothetical protein
MGQASQEGGCLRPNWLFQRETIKHHTLAVNALKMFARRPMDHRAPQILETACFLDQRAAAAVPLHKLQGTVFPSPEENWTKLRPLYLPFERTRAKRSALTSVGGVCAAVPWPCQKLHQNLVVAQEVVACMEDAAPLFCKGRARCCPSCQYKNQLNVPRANSGLRHPKSRRLQGQWGYQKGSGWRCRNQPAQNDN